MPMANARMDLTTFVGKLLEEQDGDVLRETPDQGGELRKDATEFPPLDGALPGSGVPGVRAGLFFSIFVSRDRKEIRNIQDTPTLQPHRHTASFPPAPHQGG
jgi:hypothetical protein